VASSPRTFWCPYQGVRCESHMVSLSGPVGTPRQWVGRGRPLHCPTAENFAETRGQRTKYLPYILPLQVPVQVIVSKDSSLKWPVMCWAGRKTLLTHSAGTKFLLQSKSSCLIRILDTETSIIPTAASRWSSKCRSDMIGSGSSDRNDLSKLAKSWALNGPTASNLDGSSPRFNASRILLTRLQLPGLRNSPSVFRPQTAHYHVQYKRWYVTIQYSIVQYTVQYNKIQYSTVHSTINTVALLQPARAAVQCCHSPEKIRKEKKRFNETQPSWQTVEMIRCSDNAATAQ